ncbi:MAG TPA: GNAT family N-acetyltransferase [Candidatus Acidoferrum sp.]|nr:GNAT family N-acetyltransferase [Candidatus Acidoferrum sp.]
MSELHLTLELARRIEIAEARAAMETADLLDRERAGSAAAVEHIAGGAAIYCGPNSPVTQAVGLGLAGPVSDEDMDRLENFYRTRSEAVRVETCPLADRSLVEQFHKRGYHVTEFSNVFAAPLQDPEQLIFHQELPPGASIELVSTEQLDLWTLTVAEGFAEHFPVTREILDVMKLFGQGPHTECYLVLMEGKPVGGATLAMRDGVAGLFGASTLPAYRNRGLQTALLQFRLERARAAGCDLAVSLALPGSASERNIARQGLQTLYTRVKFERDW